MAGERGTLAGKVALITGAAGGQGAAEARLFATHGCRLILTDVDTAGADVADSLGEDVWFVEHDVASETAWQSVVEAARSRFGRIDILVNNAGVFRPGSIEQTTVESFDLHYRVNQRGLFLGVKSVVGTMRACVQHDRTWCAPFGFDATIAA